MKRGSKHLTAHQYYLWGRYVAKTAEYSQTSEKKYHKVVLNSHVYHASSNKNFDKGIINYIYPRGYKNGINDRKEDKSDAKKDARTDSYGIINSMKLLSKHNKIYDYGVLYGLEEIKYNSRKELKISMPNDIPYLKNDNRIIKKYKHNKQFKSGEALINNDANNDSKDNTVWNKYSSFAKM